MANEYFSHSVKLTPGTKARAEDVNSRFDAIESGLDKLPDPHATMQGFSGAVAVGEATEGAHAISASQALAGGLSYGVDSGAANAYVVTMPISTTAYRDGLTITFKATEACTGASTINVDGLGIKQLCRSNGDPLANGDVAAGQIVTVMYSGTKFLGVAAFQGQFDEVEARATAISQQAISAVGECAAYAAQASTDKDLANISRIECNDAVTLAQGHASSASNSKDETEGLVVVAQSFANTATTKASEAAASEAATLAIFGGAIDVQNAVNSASASASSASSDATQTAADRVQTGLDRVATENDATQTAADRVQTGLDRVASGGHVGTAGSFASTATTQAGIATTQAGIATTQAGIATAKVAEIQSHTIATGAILTGGISGFEYEKTGDHAILVGPGNCLDETNQHWIQIDSSQTVTIPPGNLNTIYNLFACSDGVCRADTDQGGANLSAYTKRYLWPIITNGSGIIRDIAIDGNDLYFSKASEAEITSLTSPPAGCSTAVSLLPFCPTERVAAVLIGASGSGDGAIAVGYDGSNVFAAIGFQSAYTSDNDMAAWGFAIGGGYRVGVDKRWMPLKGDSIYWGQGTHTNTATAKLKLQGIRIRR